MQALYPERRILLLNGPDICKAENVWTGFRAATGDVLMILDGDLAVMPEELPMFFNALVENRGEFINGNRLVYPIPKAAMKFANRLGNKVFGMIFSFLLDQRIKDTLCGTKVLWRKDWSRIERSLGKLGVQISGRLQTAVGRVETASGNYRCACPLSGTRVRRD